MELHGHAYLPIAAHVFRCGDEVVKISRAYTTEIQACEKFFDLAPRYSAGPYLAVDPQRSLISMQHAGGPMAETALDRVMGFLQTIHCVLLLEGKVSLRDMRSEHILQTGTGADAQFRLVHTGGWLANTSPTKQTIDATWRNNAREVARMWADFPSVLHEEVKRFGEDQATLSDATEVSYSLCVCAGMVTDEWKPLLPPQMDALMSEIQRCGLRLCV